MSSVNTQSDLAWNYENNREGGGGQAKKRTSRQGERGILDSYQRLEQRTKLIPYQSGLSVLHHASVAQERESSPLSIHFNQAL